MKSLRSIYHTAKRTKRMQLKVPHRSRTKRYRIARLKPGQPYKIDGMDVILLPVGFGRTKLAVTFIACSKEMLDQNNPFGMYRFGVTGHITYIEAEKKLIPVPAKELPLYVGIEHCDLFEELLRKA